jgi:hypothetical protein
MLLGHGQHESNSRIPGLNKSSSLSLFFSLNKRQMSVFRWTGSRWNGIPCQRYTFLENILRELLTSFCRDFLTINFTVL